MTRWYTDHNDPLRSQFVDTNNPFTVGDKVRSENPFGGYQLGTVVEIHDELVLYRIDAHVEATKGLRPVGTITQALHNNLQRV